jgi:hypothetical protein
MSQSDNTNDEDVDARNLSIEYFCLNLLVHVYQNVAFLLPNEKLCLIPTRASSS